MPKRAKKEVVEIVIKKESISDVIVVDESESGQKPLLITCNLCQESFKSSTRMRFHQTKCFVENGDQKVALPKRIISWNNDKMTKFSCKHCNKKFKFAKSFEEHKMNVHSKLPDSIPCPKCPAKCPNQDMLSLHMAKDHSKATFKCPNCDATFSRNYHVTRHLDQKGCGPAKPKTFSCKICGSCFTRKDNLMFHLRNNHTPHLKKYQCKQCVYGVDNFITLIRHHTNRHLGKIFICDICGNAVGSRVAIAKHLESHGEKKYECDICEYKTYTIEVLRRHMNVHKRDKPYVCPSCPSSFTQPQQLRLHLSKHWSIACRLCEVQFTCKETFNDHLKEHIVNKEEVFCPFSDCMHILPFTSAQNFQTHIDEHNFKVYSCELCEKRFDSFLKLKRHTSVHVLEKPRRCMYCVRAKAYGRGDRLITHLRKEHPEVFKYHWNEVRKAQNNGKGSSTSRCKLTSRDTAAILETLDELQDKLLESKVTNVEVRDEQKSISPAAIVKTENPLMSEGELLSCLKVLLEQLIDAPMLEALDFPQEDVDVVLENVLKHCELQVADRSRWSRVQCLRENLKQMFLRVIDDPGIKKMLELHTIDQVVRNIISIKT